MKSVILIIVALLSQSALAGPQTNSSVTYQGLETCNHGSIVFSETFVNGYALTPAEGIVAVATDTDASPQVSVSSTQISGDFTRGYQFTTQSYGLIQLDANGAGKLQEEVCTSTPATANTPMTVNCTHPVITLDCQHIFPAPTGFSAGH